jgi:hypothetical protein
MCHPNRESVNRERRLKIIPRSGPRPSPSRLMRQAWRAAYWRLQTMRARLGAA